MEEVGVKAIPARERGEPCHQMSQGYGQGDPFLRRALKADSTL